MAEFKLTRMELIGLNPFSAEALKGEKALTESSTKTGGTK